MRDGVYVEVDSNGNRTWRLDNHQFHREDGPAIERADGTRSWFQNGLLHRLDGPAVESPDGDRSWFQNGRRHRVDGPAIERANGNREWFQNGRRHREDGPAIERARSGRCKWYLNNKEYTEQDFEQELLVYKWGLAVDA